MRKWLSIFLILVFMFISIPISSTVKAENKFDGYIPISTADELANIANDTTAKYYLTKDIDMASYGYWETISMFHGVLDGNGYAIKNLSISALSDGYYGIFGLVSNATVKNLSLSNIAYKISLNEQYKASNSYDSGHNRIGGIIGYINSNTLIENCNVSGAITVNVNNSYESKKYGEGYTVFATSYVGGIVGFADLESNVTNSYTNVTISVSSDYKIDTDIGYNKLSIENNIGGIAGYIGNSSSINNSFSMGNNIIGNINARIHFAAMQMREQIFETKNYIGGVVGYAEETTEINNCFNISEVTGNSYNFAYDNNEKKALYNHRDVTENRINYLGGIAGYLNGKLSNSYSSGKMENPDYSKIGGVVGFADTNAYIYRAYYLRNNSQKVKFNSEIAGVGDNTMAANATATSLDEAKMQKQTNFKDWDFKSTWQIVKGVNKGYPIFKTNTKAFQLSKATASVKAGTYKKSFSVKLSSATPDTKIYYTTDGTKPTTKSKAYTKALSIKKSTTLKVLVVRNGFQSSPVATYKYVIKK